MPHSAVPATVRHGLSPALFLVAASLVGCGPADETPSVDTTPSGAAVAGAPLACNPRWTGRIETIARAEVLEWAAELTFSARDTTRSRLNGFGAGAEMRLVGGLDTLGVCLPTARGCIIARITSARAQPRLGIGAGRNYVWADSAGDAGRVVIIPEDRTVPVRVHRLRHHRFTPGGPLPAARAPGGCGWCGDHCWCEWTTDTTSTSILRLPGEEDLIRPGGNTGPARGGT